VGQAIVFRGLPSSSTVRRRQTTIVNLRNVAYALITGPLIKAANLEGVAIAFASAFGG
jgi:hypothetical protein